LRLAEHFRRCVAIALVLSLGVVDGCKKDAVTPPAPTASSRPPAAKPSAPDSPSAQGNPSAPPQEATQIQGGPPAGLIGPSALPDATLLTPVDVKKMTPSQIQFGIAPKRTKEVEYADDAIIMEEGDKAIRSMGGNGLSWTFDANAPHVSEFQEGKVVFATGLAVGRVVGLKREGSTVTATLAPIQLTDVIKNGKFAMSQAVTTDNMISYAAPDFPQEAERQDGEKKSSYNIDEGPNDRAIQTMVLSNVKNGRWTPTSVAQTYADGRRVTYQKLGAKWSPGRVSLANVSPIRLANGYERVRLSMPPPGDPAIPTPPQQPSMPGVPGVPIPTVPNMGAAGAAAATASKVMGAPTNIDVSDVRTEAVASNSGIGVQFYFNKKGVTMFASAILGLDNPHIDFDLEIKNGKFVTAGVNVGGGLAVKMQIEAGTTNDFAQNFHKRWWEPIDFKIPLGMNGLAGVPFSVTFNTMLDVSTGFSAKTSVMKATGNYSFGGGLWAGLKNGSWSVTAASDLKAVTDLGQTTAGVSVGINSLVLSAAIRVMVGIGAFGFNTGVFVQLRFGGTILRAPDIGFPCRAGTIEAFMDFGIGYSLPKVVVAVINAVLSLFTSYRLDVVGTIAQTKPVRLFHGDTQIPASCATPKQGGG
jgi:hypothetical protein